MKTLLTELQKFVPMAKMITPRRHALPVLMRICFDGKVISASNLKQHVTIPQPTKGKYQIPVRTLAGILGNRPKTLLITEKLSGSFEMLNVAFDGITATIPKGGSIREFPGVPRGSFRSLGSWPRDFVRMLEQQLLFVSTDELKPSLNGVYIEIKDGLVESCSTDGHFLRLVKNWKIGAHEDFTGIIPTKAIRFLAKFMGESVKVTGDDVRLKFILDGGVVLYSRIIDEKYPDYMSVVPDDFSGSALFDRDAALKELRGLKQFCNSTTKQIAIGVTNSKAALTAIDVETDSRGESSFPLEESEGEITIGYNIEYLMKILRACGKTVRWEWGTPVTAALFYEPGQDDVRNLLMPIRLND